MTHEILAQNADLTMSSREIAKLLCKNHSNIKISAERLAEKGTIALQGSHFNHNGNNYNEWLLNKRDSLILVAQNSPEFTAAIVDRWQELESAAQKPAVILPDFSNPAEAARAWAQQYELNTAAKEQLQIAAPKVEFFDTVQQSDKTFKLQEAGKKLQQKPNKFIAWLRRFGYTDKTNIPYQRYINQGLFKTHTGASESGHTYTQCRMTDKGLTYFAEKLKESE